MSETAIQQHAIFHITHWKAGSQWVKAVIGRAAGDRFVRPEEEQAHLDPAALRPGGVYSPVYLGRNSFTKMVGDLPHRRFIVVRDLRDTLVSWYFSLRYSHPTRAIEFVADLRSELSEKSVDDALESLIRGRLEHMANIQRSWMSGDELIVRYEDLLADEQAGFARICRHIELRVGPNILRQIVTNNSFERRTGGRTRGSEDLSSHRRKGVAGDWKNHFSERIKDVFKEKFGQHLIDTGYEADLDW